MTRPVRATIVAAALLAVQAAALLAMGRRAICACGYVALWHGRVDAGNSQHLLDWYSLSHLVHGLLFFAGTWLVARRAPIAWRYLAALAIEAAWEVVENTPAVIAHYRMTATALGYEGDSVVNSLGDAMCMSLGFVIASRLPWWGSVAAALALELAAFVAIRDNLLLSVAALLGTLG